jgi:hypothetical protein
VLRRVALAIALVVAAASAARAETIAGTLVDARTGEPLRDFRVELASSRGIIGSVATSSAGVFRFKVPGDLTETRIAVAPYSYDSRATALYQTHDIHFRVTFGTNAAIRVFRAPGFLLQDDLHARSVSSAFQPNQVFDTYTVTRWSPALGSSFTH